MAAFCLQLGVPSSTFYVWRSCLAQAPLPSSQREPLERSQLLSARSVARPGHLGRLCAYRYLGALWLLTTSNTSSERE